MSVTNPFKQSYIRMKFPPDKAGVLSIAGFNLEADEDGCVELPIALKGDAESHGLFVAPEQAPEEAPEGEPARRRGRKE